MYAILLAERTIKCFRGCAREFSRKSALTTPLTIYGFGLCGRSALGSLGKHRFPIQKHWKSPESAYFTGLLRFGYWRPGVRISTLRPKREGQPQGLSFSFWPVCPIRLHSRFARMEFAYPVRRSTSSLVRRRTRISSPTANTSTLAFFSEGKFQCNWKISIFMV